MVNIFKIKKIMKTLSENEILKLAKLCEIDWYSVSKEYALSEDFIQEFKDMM